MVDLRLTRDGVDDWLLTVCHKEAGEVHTQLKTEVEEFIIHVRSVLRYLCFYRTQDIRQKTKD